MLGGPSFNINRKDYAWIPSRYKFPRLGVLETMGTPHHPAYRKAERLTIILETLLDKHVEPDLAKMIKSNHPKRYQNGPAVGHHKMRDHIVHGRTFEMSMLLFEARQCDCCRRVAPGHLDDGMVNEKDSMFECK